MKRASMLVLLMGLMLAGCTLGSGAGTPEASPTLPTPVITNLAAPDPDELPGPVGADEIRALAGTGMRERPRRDDIDLLHVRIKAGQELSRGLGAGVRVDGPDRVVLHQDFVGLADDPVDVRRADEEDAGRRRLLPP